MGAFLGQNETLELRKSGFQNSELGCPDCGMNDGLGADPGTIITTAASVFNSVSGLFGGSSCSSAQKQQKQQIAEAISTYLTRTDMRELVRGMESNVQPTPTDMAHFYLGGRDCKHKNVTPGDQRFLDRLPQLIAQREQEAKAAEQQQQSSGNGQQTVQAGYGGFIKSPFLIGSLVVGGGTIAYLLTTKKKK
jgi:hypothetical protein